jgi:cytoskeletal protein RodZ
MSDRMSVDIGSRLREARERRGVSLRAIAESTKISIAVLEALERNDVSRLPGGIFSRAFVRSYATEVGLDPEATIQEFVAQFPQESVTAGHQMMPPLEGSRSFDSNPRISRAIVRLLGLSVPVAAVVLYFSTATPRNWWPMREASPRPAAGEPKPTDAALPAPSTPAPTSAPASAPAPPPVATAAPPAATPPAPAVPAAEKLQVAVAAKRPCWVSATVDGKKAIEQLLEVGDQRTIDIQREMVLTAGDAAAIALTLNGAAGRPLGKAGEVVTVRVNPNNFREYLASR